MIILHKESKHEKKINKLEEIEILKESQNILNDIINGRNDLSKMPN